MHCNTELNDHNKQISTEKKKYIEASLAGWLSWQDGEKRSIYIWGNKYTQTNMDTEKNDNNKME